MAESSLSLSSSSSLSASACCCSLSRWRVERNLGWFDLKDWNGRLLDTQRTFAPRPKTLTVTLKFLSLLGVVLAVAYNISTIGYLPRPFWMAWYTNWSVVTVMLYQVCSLLCTLLHKQTNKQNVTLWVKLTWVTYPLAAVPAMAAAVLYWLFVYDGGEDGAGPTALDVIKHGVLAMLVLLDGLFINYIPVRVKHLWLVVIFNVLYIIWNVIHSFTDIGNPLENDNDPNTDDDAIYEVLNWKERPREAFLYTVLSNVVLVPLLALLLWTLSSAGGWYRFDASWRRYKNEDLNRSLLMTSSGRSRSSGTARSSSGRSAMV